MVEVVADAEEAEVTSVDVLDAFGRNGGISPTAYALRALDAVVAIVDRFG